MKWPPVVVYWRLSAALDLAETRADVFCIHFRQLMNNLHGHHFPDSSTSLKENEKKRVKGYK